MESLKNLTSGAYERATSYIKSAARPLERARLEYEFEAAPDEPALQALEQFRNEDGGFGHGLEPDLWMPSSSVLCTIEALHLLKELDVPRTHDFVIGAVDWLVAAFDPALSAWRHVTKEAEAYPHALHWKWELHADGTRWPVGVLPRAEVLAYLWRSAQRVPRELLEDQTARLVSDLTTSDKLDLDSVSRCEHFVRATEVPREARDAVAGRMIEVGSAIVSRDPKDWSGYCANPLWLAPSPDLRIGEASRVRYRTQS